MNNCPLVLESETRRQRMTSSRSRSCRRRRSTGTRTRPTRRARMSRLMTRMIRIWILGGRRARPHASPPQDEPRPRPRRVSREQTFLMCEYLRKLLFACACPTQPSLFCAIQRLLPLRVAAVPLPPLLAPRSRPLPPSPPRSRAGCRGRGRRGASAAASLRHRRSEGGRRRMMMRWR